ncbi:alpha/beta hydrolase family protein [Xenophilus azovorans]|uniref:alpha/beta hydrolase family protein n=1 Tax=Xenophilus azovorans TaxID=151755 RepID=UPI000571F101|nr:alpha/beta fold hydrolase [Xenophilus azovorans]
MTIQLSAVEIPVADQRIEGSFVTTSALLPGVLLVHGWDGSQAQYIARAHELAALGCICLTIDLRGHARHRAQRMEVTPEDNLQDVLAGLDTLRSHPGVDERAIAIVGSSYGGYLAALATALRPVRWLALRAPAIYEDPDWQRPKGLLDREKLNTYRRGLIPAESNRALRACGEFRGDVLVVESETDNMVPHEVIRSYVNAFKQAHSLTYRVLSGADHALSADEMRQAYGLQLVNWMTEMLLGAKAASASVRPVPRAPA